MSHNNNRIPKYKNPTEANFAKAAKDVLKQKFDPAPHTTREVLEAKAKTLSMTVQQHIMPIVKAGGALKETDRDNLEAVMFQMFFEAFDSKMFTREELAALCAIIHSQAMRASIEDDPGGTGSPDILSGQ